MAPLQDAITERVFCCSYFWPGKSGISLSQIYVPLRAYWEDQPSESWKDRNRDGRLPKYAKGEWLDDNLDAWSTQNDPKDWLRLIGGGPGSGKSTTLKAFASRLAENETLRSLFIPLQHIGIEGDLRASINRYFTQTTGGSFTHEPLSRRSVEMGTPIILIFDGLDELVAPNENARETVSLFTHKLSSLIAELRGESAISIKAVVSGRMLAFQAARKLLTLPKNASLEVYGYAPASLRGLDEPNDIWKIDQRPHWWTKYATAKNISIKLPEAFGASELDSITHEPLLAYLLVLAGFSSHNWERAAENPNRIYATLMSDIYNRGWGEGAAKVRSTTCDEFNLLMQTIGLAAWLGGDARVASEGSVIAAIDITRAQDAWRSFNDDHGPDVTNLAMNFYLKAADKAGRGFEFTHKSFGEYLAALAILEVASQVCETPRMRMEHVLQDWINATGSGKMSDEIVTFLRREVRLRWQEGGDSERKKLALVKDTFEKIAGAAIVEGFPNSRSPSSFQVLETRQLNAEVAAWVVLNAVVRAIIELDGCEGVTVKIPEINKTSFRLMLARHAAAFGFSSRIHNCLTAIEIEELYIFGAIVATLDLSYARIGRIIFEVCYLFNASFISLKAGTIGFYNCAMFTTNFRGAVLENATFFDSKIRGVNIDSSNSSSILIDEESILISFDSLDDLPTDDVKLIDREESVDSVIRGINEAKRLIEKLHTEGRTDDGPNLPFLDDPA